LACFETANIKKTYGSWQNEIIWRFKFFIKHSQMDSKSKRKKKDLIKQARSNRNAERSTMRKQMFFKVRKKNRYKTRMKYKEG